MKKLLASLVMALSITISATPKAQAGIGALISVPAVVTIGGVAAASGALLFVDAAGLIWRPISCHQSGAVDFSCLGSGMVSILMITAGLIVLDNEDGKISFHEANKQMKHLKNFSSKDIAQYNSELDQLNAINAEIAEEVSLDETVDAKSRWEDLGTHLSPATMQIAGANAANLLKSLK